MVPNLTTSEDPRKSESEWKRRHVFFWYTKKPQKTNMEPENQWLEDRISFLNGWFSVLCVSFRGNSSCSIRRSTKTPSTQKEHEPWEHGWQNGRSFARIEMQNHGCTTAGAYRPIRNHGVTDLEILTFRPIKHIYGLQLKETLSKACVILHPNRYCFNGLFHNSTYSQLGSRVISCDFQGKNRSYCYIQYPNTRCPDLLKKGGGHPVHEWLWFWQQVLAVKGCVSRTLR